MSPGISTILSKAGAVTKNIPQVTSVTTGVFHTLSSVFRGGRYKTSTILGQQRYGDNSWDRHGVITSRDGDH